MPKLDDTGESLYRHAYDAIRAIIADMESSRPRGPQNAHAWEVELQGKVETAIAIRYGLRDHPKRELLWQKAYERGHAAGWYEVLAEYDDLSELLR